jgi:2-methylcitrate dehydratase PrpD
MSHISRIFARYALEKSNFSEAAKQSAKTFMQDSLGVGIAGSKAPFQDAVFATVSQWGAGDAAYLWGNGQKAPVASAAYLNAFQIHSMEYDCVHEPAVVHPMATIFGALSAEADSKGLSGTALLEAVIVAVDVAVEVGVAAKTPLKFFRPATAGLFGATLGVARLRGFNEATAMSAMGCALAQCAGVMQAHVEGKPTLPIQIAGAARAAIVACDLAERGLAGPDSSLEGSYGYFAMFEDESDAEQAAKNLGSVHRISEVSWKPFPTGRAAQGGIVLIQKLLEKGATFDSVKSLTLSAPPIIPRLVDRPVVDNMTANYARLCFPYLAPIALKRGTINLSDFSAKDLNDPAIKAFSNNVNVETNSVSDPAAFVPQVLSATLDDGRIIEARIDKLFGSTEEPLSPAQHKEKFLGCLSFGLSDINAQKVGNRLLSLIESIESVSDVSDIYALAAG